MKANPAGVRLLVNSFLRTVDDISQELAQSLQQRDHDRAKALLHTLTGSALSTGAVGLAEACKRLAREWERPESPGHPTIEPLLSEIRGARDALRDFLETLADDAIPAAPATGARPHTVLLVEDNPTVRMQVRLLLEDKFRIAEAADGQEALLSVERQLPDLAIVDLHLGHASPDSPSGFRLLELFKNRIPTVVLTVDQRPESIRRAIECGAWSYLLKTPDLENLYPSLLATLARSRELWDEPPNPSSVAAGWLMATFHLDRETADRVLVGFATEQRRRVPEVAQDIIAAQKFIACLNRYIARHVQPRPAVALDGFPQNG